MQCASFNRREDRYAHAGASEDESAILPEFIQFNQADSTPADGAKDVFVHISALQASGIQSLREGQQITFDTEPDRTGKGPKAVNIDIV